MKRIGYLVPGTGLKPEERARRKKILSALAGPGFSVDLLEVDEGPPAIESAEDELRAVGPTLALAQKHQDGFDAYIIGCFGDVGIDALRGGVTVPVVGPARVTYAAAAIFPSFSVLALNSGFIEEELELICRLGLRTKLAQIAAAELAVDRIIGDPEGTLARLVDLANDLGGEAVVLGCMSLAFLLEERGVERLGRLFVVNPLRCALGVAKALIT